MQRAFSPSTPVYKQFFQVRSLPFYLLVATLLFSVLLVFAFWLLDWALWGLGLLILAAWLPLIMTTMSAIYQQNRWLALLYLLVTVQGAHMIEHLSQMVELHLLGLAGPKASGIIGFLNIEWVHMTWNTLMLICAVMLFYGYRHNVWLLVLLLFSIYHEIEHIYIMSVYLSTHAMGNPGLLAQGGLIGGGLPIKRPDLHAIYAVFQETLLVIAYLQERKKAILLPRGRSALS